MINGSVLWFLFFIHCISLVKEVDGKKNKMNLISIEKCKLPKSELDVSDPVTYDIFARKVNRETTVLRTNFTFTKPAGPILFATRGYQIQQNAIKDLVFKLDKIACNDTITQHVYKLIKLNFDPNCNADPGNYIGDDINIEEFAWIFSKAMTGLGKYSYDIELSTLKGVIVCFSITCDVVQIK